MKAMNGKKGFTLIELIIVIAILGIIALIAIPNLAGIQQRSQVNADRRTAEQIGKAVRIWYTDSSAATGTRNIPTTATEFTNANCGSAGTVMKGLAPDYISVPAVPKSWTDGTGAYFISSIGKTETSVTGQKVIVGIAKTGTADPIATAPTDQAGLAYNGATTAGWCYLEQ